MEKSANEGKEPYEPPQIEDVPLAPGELVLAACKASGQQSPLCPPNPCSACSGVGS